MPLLFCPLFASAVANKVITREVLRRGRLRSFEHVERRDEEEWLKKCTKMDVGGVRPKEWPRKIWELW